MILDKVQERNKVALHPSSICGSAELCLAAFVDGQYAPDHTLAAMNEQGYAYRIIGSTGPVEFDIKSVGATPIKANQQDICQGSLHISPNPEAGT